MNSGSINSPLLTRLEVIEKLRICDNTLRKHCRHGLPVVRLGRRVLFRESDINEYLDQLPTTSKNTGTGAS